MRNTALILAAISTASATFCGVESLSTRSPFLPSTVVADTAGGAALASLELTGLLSVGGKMQFSVRDTASGRSVWIGLGDTSDGLTVRSFEEGSSSVIIEGRGGSRRLTLKEARVDTAIAPGITFRPMPGPGQTATSPGVPGQVFVSPAVAQPQARVPLRPESPAAAERDARMLVSDLLEISIQERRRHEERVREQGAAKPPEELQ